MNVGDPKKAIVLAIVAVIVVSVAVFRVMPSGETRIPASTLIARDKTAEANAPKALDPPDQLKVDSFSHPNLAATQPDGNKSGDQPLAEARRMSSAKHNSSLVAPFDPTSSAIGNEGAAPLPNTKPDENTGIGQQQKGDLRAGLPVRLDAVVRSGEAMALLSVAHGAASPCHEGSLVNGHIKVLKIKESSIVIEASGKRIEISVGEEVAL